MSGAPHGPDAALEALARGVVLPAHPLALDASRRLDERRQRALTRYYVDAGAGGVAVGVHTTQFAIRETGLLEPVLDLAREELDRADTERSEPLVRVAGVIGPTHQALGEAELARSKGYHAGLLGLGALRDASDEELVAHCRAVAEVIPLFGFYLQPSVGGRPLGHAFWTRFAEIDGVVAIKVACFERYGTIDVVRALVETGRDDIALYTGNDDNIVLDLITPYRLRRGSELVERRFVGGLLGHWAVWTRSACELFARCRQAATGRGPDDELLRLAVEVTDMNAALFDAANGFHGCVPGVHEALRRRGILAGTTCLDRAEMLSPGQAAEIARVEAAYPWLVDAEFVESHRDRWLAG